MTLRKSKKKDQLVQKLKETAHVSCYTDHVDLLGGNVNCVKNFVGEIILHSKTVVKVKRHKTQSLSYSLLNNVGAGADVEEIDCLKPAGHVMHHQFNIQQLYALSHTVFMCFVFI